MSDNIPVPDAGARDQGPHGTIDDVSPAGPGAGDHLGGVDAPTGNDGTMGTDAPAGDAGLAGTPDVDQPGEGTTP